MIKRRIIKQLSLVILLAISVISVHAAKTALQVHADFSGGAVKVIQIDQEQRQVTFEPPVFAQGGQRVWWYFKISGVTPGETVRICNQYSIKMPYKIVVSFDHKQWQFVDLNEAASTIKTRKDDNKSKGNILAYDITVPGDSVWVAFYVPYTLERVQEMISNVQKAGSHVQPFQLATTRMGNPVPGVHISDPNDTQSKPVVWLIARQHAFEAAGPWILQGLIEWLVSAEPRAVALRQKAVVTVIPIMDIDSVQIGAGGRQQLPHDHNRDWTDESTPHWPEVAAAQKLLLKAEAENRLVAFFDIHGPGWDSNGFQLWYHGKTAEPERSRNMNVFAEAAEAEIKTIPAVRVLRELTEATSRDWLQQHTRDSVIMFCVEARYGPHNYKEYTGDPAAYNLQAGKELGLAIERYLQIIKK